MVELSEKQSRYHINVFFSTKTSRRNVLVIEIEAKQGKWYEIVDDWWNELCIQSIGAPVYCLW